MKHRAKHVAALVPRDKASAAVKRVPFVMIGVGVALLVVVGLVLASVFAVGSHKNAGIVIESGSSASLTPSPSAATGTLQPTSPPADAPPATRWWSNAAGGVGSSIDVEQPNAAAANLKPDGNAYCSMLSSSLKGGHNPFLLDATSSGNLAVTMKAWLAEIEALADPPIAQAWAQVGPVLLARLQPGTAVSASPGPDVSQSVGVIAQDATNRCKLDLSHTES